MSYYQYNQSVCMSFRPFEALPDYSDAEVSCFAFGETRRWS